MKRIIYILIEKTDSIMAGAFGIIGIMAASCALFFNRPALLILATGCAALVYATAK